MEYNHRIQANSLIVKDEGWEKAVKTAYKKDIWAQHVLKELPTNTKIIVINGIIFVKEKIYLF
jgi:hypothetical protein